MDNNTPTKPIDFTPQFRAAVAVETKEIIRLNRSLDGGKGDWLLDDSKDAWAKRMADNPIDNGCDDDGRPRGEAAVYPWIVEMDRPQYSHLWDVSIFQGACGVTMVKRDQENHQAVAFTNRDDAALFRLIYC